MPGHVYIRVGRYADAIEANRHAVHADESYLEGPYVSRRGIYPQGYYPHNYHFMSFAASMAGNSETAIYAATTRPRCRSRIARSWASSRCAGAMRAVLSIISESPLISRML